MSGAAFLFDAVRTPRGKGKAGGALAAVKPAELVRQLIEALRARHGAVAVDSAERLVLSCVGQVGAQGGHIAMVSKLHAALPDRVAAQTLNNFCAGGLSAIGAAAAAVESGGAGLILAGGVEAMSQVPFLADRADYYADPDTARALAYVPVAIAADYLADRRGVARDELDAATLESHRRAHAAWEAGRYESSVIPVRTAQGGVALARDETIRPDLTPETLAALPPAFEALGRSGFDAVIAAHKAGTGAIEHRHSTANCPPIADGAALALIGTAAAGAALGLRPRARIARVVETGGDPIEQLTAGTAALERLLAATGLTLGEVDLIEYMEAFAVVPVLFLRDSGVDPAIVNVNGGHLALGHPMGATGAMLVATLLAEMERRDVERGIVVAHGGSGVGVAALLERL